MAMNKAIKEAMYRNVPHSHLPVSFCQEYLHLRSDLHPQHQRLLMELFDELLLSTTNAAALSRDNMGLSRWP